jgi:hypothetical protein
MKVTPIGWKCVWKRAIPLPLFIECSAKGTLLQGNYSELMFTMDSRVIEAEAEWMEGEEYRHFAAKLWEIAAKPHLI